jgi:hypothetical protein
LLLLLSLLLLCGRFCFVLLGLGVGFFLPRGFVFLLLVVLGVDKGRTSDQDGENY